MPEPRLLIDLGNSRIKWLWARGAELEAESAGQGDFAALEQAVTQRGAARPAAVLISSVAEAERTAHVANLCVGLWGVQPRLLASQAEQCGVRNGYRDPARLGVDRWLAILGAVGHYGKPVVVCDLGTATTLDAVDETGQHLGGWILPGPATMLDSLAKRTTLQAPEHLLQARALEPGRSTADAIRSGVLAAQLGALHQFIGRVSTRIGRNPRLVVTGGATATVTSLLDIDCVQDPWLVFRGMSIV